MSNRPGRDDVNASNFQAQDNEAGFFSGGFDFLDRGRDLISSAGESLSGAVSDFGSFAGVDFFGESDPNAYTGSINRNTGRGNDMNINAIERANPTNINGMLQGELFGVPTKLVAGVVGGVVLLAVLRKVL